MNLFHAYGLYTSVNGETYEGDYHSGKKQGNGVFTWPDGSKYDGPYKDNKKHGVGFWHDENGQITKREYREDIHYRTIDTSEN